MSFNNALRTFLTIIIVAFFANGVQAQNEAELDTLQGDLGEILVTGYEGNRSLMETPGAITNIEPERVSGFDESSLVYGLNTVPGVRIERRAVGSYRVAIRGSSLRAPYGVRNVKIYWNGIPFTEPSGSTPLNLLDVINMQEVEVIKGPAGSIYGAGTGGAILMESRQSSANEVGAGTVVGSYGLQRYTAYAQQQYENGSLRFNYSNQHTNGYRQQNFLYRETAELSGQFQLNDRQIIKTSFLYSDIFYGIPGPLTAEQVEQNPRQARQGNPFALGSVEANASINQEMFLAGLTHDVQITEGISNLTTVYGNFSTFDHPFNLDYKKDSRKTGGGRTRFYFDTDIGEVRTRFTLGGEYQAAANAARNFENDTTQVGALNFDDEIRIQSSLLFFNTEVDLPYNFYLTAGLSYNRLEYRLDRLVTNLEGDTAGVAQKSFEPEIIPRVGLVKKFSPELSLHGSVSYGFSPPTIEEFRTNEGSIALNLEAEQGTNYEIGARGGFQNLRLSYDVTAFYFKLDETIVQQEPEDPTRDTYVFRNTGATDQYGLEAATSWRIIQNPVGFLQQLDWDLSYTYHDFEFKNYVKEGQDFSGNELTGVAPHIFVTNLRGETSPGIYTTANYTFTDKIPLNDANTVYSDAYHLLQTKIGYQRTIAENFVVDLFVGIDNVLNVDYSLGNDLNAFGERYYQPAPPRNWFGGVKMNYVF
ncbi:TonB-dependent receptor family protein [Gracilimonas mengyeensis]|uniref:Iron complex outermembrane recepter protein n=1 Tax=Gracilimonas mengyeensis TaxID=1302730 RepID=A0A521F5I0_9BACT|nr:TonB-dependent receptor [Gracilimonas mengyeensis]SMO91478.1 iron complex outermembrane recepter protein [Gracilimonas mengyeensis]